MTTFAIFDRPGEPVPATVPEKFSWFAALLPPLFALVHGLRVELLAWGLALVVITAAGMYIGGEAAFWLYVVFAVWIGFEAAAFRRDALARKGWRHAAELVASGPDVAAVEWLGRRGRR